MRLACGLALLILVLAAAACAGGTAEKAGSERAQAAGERIDGEQLPPIQNDLGPRGYRRLVLGSFRLLNEFWNNQLPDLGAEPGPPSRLISYWSRRQDPGCGGRPVGVYNAQYCTGAERISWDGRWVYGDLYRRIGDVAVMFVLGHEYGHLVQDRLGIDREFPLTIESELNADCLAGAWLGHLNEKLVRFNRVDYAALRGGLFAVGDGRGVRWRNPQAHGRPGERRHAVEIGARNGQRACLQRLGPGFSR